MPCVVRSGFVACVSVTRGQAPKGHPRYLHSFFIDLALALDVSKRIFSLSRKTGRPVVCSFTLFCKETTRQLIFCPVIGDIKLHPKAHRGGDEEPTQAHYKYVEERDEETTKVSR